MTFYAGDEYTDDTFPDDPDDPELHDVDAELQAIEDEYDREQSR